MALGKRVFILKTYGTHLYKWSPQESDKVKLKSTNGGNDRPYFCTAIAGSQGEDWITTYSYNIIVINGKQQRLAYVECDYVE